MLTDAQREYIGKVCLTLQIIVGALAAGVLMFLAIVIYLVWQNPPAAAPDMPVVTYAAYAAAACGIASFVVPNLAATGARKSLIAGDVSQWGLVKNLPNIDQLGEIATLAAIYQTRTIIGAALCEGAAFFACIAYMIEHQRPVLIVAGVLLLLILRYVPTPSRVESWIESEATTIQQMRQLR